MIEIIPNWHPVIVHFAIAPLTISTVLFLFVLLPDPFKVRDELLITAKWCLYIGTVSSLFAVASGWQAYTSVVHDAQGHAAMSIHRIWALIVLVLFLIACLLCRFTQGLEVKLWFLLYLTIASGSLAVTGYLGAENVYRHGLGVMRLPESDEPAHHMDDSSTHNDGELNSNHGH